MDQGEFVEAVLDVVHGIPAGKVMTYGGIAAVLGSKAARAVGHTMAWYGSDAPWWRVVRASGRPAAGLELRALPHYREEGTPLRGTDDDYRIDLRAAMHDPFSE